MSFESTYDTATRARAELADSLASMSGDELDAHRRLGDIDEIIRDFQRARAELKPGDPKAYSMALQLFLQAQEKAAQYGRSFTMRTLTMAERRS